VLQQIGTIRRTAQVCPGSLRQDYIQTPPIPSSGQRQVHPKVGEILPEKILPLRREILAIDAAAPIRAGRCDCLTIQVNCGFAVE
jgi:hypothetical protein